MRQINRHLYALIANAAKMCGTLDPNEMMPYFEEHLTFREADTIWEFLQWCHDNNKPFGHGNYNERFAEWRAATKVKAGQ